MAKASVHSTNVYGALAMCWEFTLAKRPFHLEQKGSMGERDRGKGRLKPIGVYVRCVYKGGYWGVGGGGYTDVNSKVQGSGVDKREPRLIC